MFSIIAQLAGIFLGALGVFAGAVQLVKVFTGCTTDEAVEKVQRAISGKTVASLASDAGFYNDLCQALQGIIGEKRYGDLAKLDAALRAAGHTPVIAASSNSDLPCVVVAVQPNDDTEKQIIETVLIGITKKQLIARGLGSEVLGDWKMRGDIKTPYLEIRYPNNAQDRKVILDTIVRDGIAVIDSNSSLTDDEDF